MMLDETEGYPAECIQCKHDYVRGVQMGDNICPACQNSHGPEKTNPLIVSFSGGKTSAYMARRLIDSGFSNLTFIFANTGCEAEETLEFVHRCEKEWLLNIVWVEAVVHHGKRKGSTHRVVSFDTASRNGEPFEEVVKKYGIPNKAYPHCTRELKLNPILSYLSKIGLGEAPHAVGIRADEKRRAGARGKVWHPLREWGVTKPDVNDFWADQPFTLELDEHCGNCVWCWKKSTPKLVRVYKERPGVFDFPARMEREHGLSGFNEDGTPRVFFRGHLATADIIALAEDAGAIRPPPNEDDDGGCSESCEAFLVSGESNDA